MISRPASGMGRPRAGRFWSIFLEHQGVDRFEPCASHVSEAQTG